VDVIFAESRYPRAREVHVTRWWLMGACLVACGRGPAGAIQSVEVDAAPEELAGHCREAIGEPRVEEVSPGVFVAIGYDLANTVLIATDDGNIIIDTSMSPSRARRVREALDAVAPGPVRAVIYTHSHADHVGGASVWVEEGTEVWATERLTPHFFKQYGTFLAAEATRARRQFGQGIGEDRLPCSAIGARPDIDAALEMGFVLPTHTFAGTATLTVGGVTLELVEAHGETDDQLFVWWAERGLLLAGDNYYQAFPNLYTIRGARPRPVDEWVQSLDAMRALEPELLLPSHTIPVHGQERIAEELTAYRDAIQWVKDEVVRAANAGESVDEMAARIALPAHLASRPALQPRYGTVPWSVRAIYANELGWFDGKASALLPPDDVARRSIDLAGGPEAVAEAARSALAGGELDWSAHLVGWLDADQRLAQSVRDELAAEVYAALGEEQGNTNARAYLMVAAEQRLQGVPALGQATLSDDFVAALPLEQLFEIMRSRLIVSRADVYESVRIRFLDEGRQVILTVRRGLLEVRWGEPLPGTPAPIATLDVDAAIWKALALGQRSRVGAFLAGDLAIEGDRAGLQRFMARFQDGLAIPASAKP
jgi:alkyl sulfatase BDS1-like metallo-beta-lactamase superfamily hydrolase